MGVLDSCLTAVIRLGGVALFSAGVFGAVNTGLAHVGSTSLLVLPSVALIVVGLVLMGHRKLARNVTRTLYDPRK